jgi:hypoxanthine-DNA glycosylase
LNDFYKKAIKMSQLDHPFLPVYDEDSRLLILGSFPSVRSRECGFYYTHPRNRFWEILSIITKTDKIPVGIDEKKTMLLENKIALWDVIKSCTIDGSADHSIKNATKSDLKVILKNSDIKQIFLNGDKAYRLYKKHWLTHISIEIMKLPSSSPANASYNLARLIAAWSAINKHLY